MHERSQPVLFADSHSVFVFFCPAASVGFLWRSLLCLSYPLRDIAEWFFLLNKNHHLVMIAGDLTVQRNIIIVHWKTWQTGLIQYKGSDWAELYSRKEKGVCCLNSLRFFLSFLPCVEVVQCEQSSVLATYPTEGTWVHSRGADLRSCWESVPGHHWNLQGT